MTLNTLSLTLLFHTIRHLKATQIGHQIKYRLKKVRPLSHYNCAYNPKKLSLLKFSDFLPTVNQSYLDGTFTFLNESVYMGKDVDWEFYEKGKLWNYNLQYGDYLLQENVDLYERIALIKGLHQKLFIGKVILEPYPASLRIMNTVRFICRHNLEDVEIMSALHAELDFLNRRLEFHLLGNHLLENAYAMLMGGAFFSNNAWINRGHEVLLAELNEQILPDGGHFELSPMYHQIMLYRLLELIDWYSKWKNKADEMLSFFKAKATAMAAWLRNMTFSNGEIPHFNDSTIGVTYTSEQLLAYADFLGIQDEIGFFLKESGYRRFQKRDYEFIIDVADVGASYQPGHGHADALSFVLHYKTFPLLVEAGTSTYENGKQRYYEKSTSSHNTVTINNEDQSQIWGSFRMGKRARVTVLQDRNDSIEAQHDGYVSKFNVLHKRKVDFFESKVEIYDEMKNNGHQFAFARFHVHPSIRIIEENAAYKLGEYATIYFRGELKVKIEQYQMSQGFNQRVWGDCLNVCFIKELVTVIDFVNQVK